MIYKKFIKYFYFFIHLIYLLSYFWWHNWGKFCPYQFFLNKSDKFL